MKARIAIGIKWVFQHPAHALVVLIAALASCWVATNVGWLAEVPPGHFSGKVTRNIELDYAAGLLWWSLIALGIWLLGGSDRHHLLISWSAKFFVVLVAMLFYEYKYRYNLDAFGYFNTVLTGEYFMYQGVNWYEESWIPTFKKTIISSIEDKLIQSPGTENMLRILLIIAQITGPSYHAIKVVYSFIGFLGAWFTYRAAVVIIGRPFLPAFYALMLYPSILFWSSILGKDPVFLFFIGIYAYGGSLWLMRRSPIGLAWLALALTGSYMLRPWMAAIEAGPLAFATMVRFFGLIPVLLFCLLLVPALLWETGFEETMKSMGVSVLIEELATKVEGQASQTGSGADLDVGEAQAMLSSPVGLLIILFSALFRPLPFEVTNLLVAVAALENTALLIVAMASLRYFKVVYLQHPLLLWPMSYVLTWAGLYGLVILANFGAGMRYKLQVLPFTLLVLFLLLHREGRAVLEGANKQATPLTGKACAGRPA